MTAQRTVVPAYEGAPSVISEIGWVARNARLIANATCREFWLRKAALMDCIAIKEADKYAPAAAARAAEAARGAARQLIEYDADLSATSREAVAPVGDGDHRGYVRQEYAAWRESAPNL